MSPFFAILALLAFWPAHAAEFSLSDEALPDEWSVAVLAGEWNDTVRHALEGAKTYCPGDALTGEKGVCAPGNSAKLAALVQERVKAWHETVDPAVVKAFKNATDPAALLTSTEADCLETQEQAALLVSETPKTIAAIRNAQSDADLDRVWRAQIRGEWESELSTETLDTVCEDREDSISVIHSTSSAYFLREVIAEFSATGKLSSWLELHCEKKGSGQARLREAARVAVLAKLKRRPELVGLALEQHPILLRAHHDLDKNLAAAAAVAPQACGKATSQGPLACLCVSDAYASALARADDHEANSRLLAHAREASSRISNFLSRSRLSPDVQAKLRESIDFSQARLRTFRASSMINARGGKPEIAVSVPLAAIAGTPQGDAIARATLAHELGHQLEVMLDRQEPRSCRAPASAEARSFCQRHGEIQKAMTAGDAQVLREMRDCLDRGFILGEWQATRRALQIPELPEPRRIAAKRSEAFADAFMRGELHAMTPDARAAALTFACEAHEKLLTYDLLDAVHPSPAHRIASALNESDDPTQGPPFACEKVLAR